MFTPEAVAGYASTAVLTILNLLVTYFVLKRFLFKPIMNILRKRREEVESELADAAEKVQHADDKLADASIRLDNSNHEAATILMTARNQADTLRESILTEAKRESSNMLTRAETEISRMRVSILNEVRDEVADLSVAIASKVIGHVMDEQRQKELVEKYLDEQMLAKRGEQ